MLVDSNNLHLNAIAHFANLVNTGDETRVEFADMAKAIAAGQDFDKRAEFLDAGYLAFVHTANLNFFRDGCDTLAGRFGTFSVGVADVDGAVVFDVDLGARALLNALDVLAARPDEHTDLFGVDMHSKQAGSIL